MKLKKLIYYHRIVCKGKTYSQDLKNLVRIINLKIFAKLRVNNIRTNFINSITYFVIFH